MKNYILYYLDYILLKIFNHKYVFNNILEILKILITKIDTF